MKKIFYLFFLLLIASCEAYENTVVFMPEGELKGRVERNKKRLEEDKYLPENVFLTEEQSNWWPGDTEGRTILGLVCDSKALGVESQNLREIISLVPSHLNEKGYMGTDHGDVIDEQQLSGHGWLLRGLCEYYRLTADEIVLETIRSVCENLFVRHAGKYHTYPIEPSERDREGAESGHISVAEGSWRLSSDTGCIFIGMDGLIDAYDLLRTEEIRNVIEEMLDKFYEIDIVGVKAQAHASLTGCRGLVRFAEITGNKEYIKEAQKRWELYKQYGMTDTYANYNWLCRYDTWTEPCAIVDSYILALKLWEHTAMPSYLEDAHLIWYNAICHAQRENGGFGCDTCPGETSGYDFKVHCDEAHWCCTMRGAEALYYAVRSLAYEKEGCLVLTAYHDGVITHRDTKLRIETDYPYEGRVVAEVLEGGVDEKGLEMFVPKWMNVAEVKLNGQSVGEDFAVINDSFLRFNGKLSEGDKVEVDYSLECREEEPMNRDNFPVGVKRKLSGPLVLDVNDEPIMHNMSPEVCISSGYKRVIHRFQ